MKKVLLGTVIGALGWQAYLQSQQPPAPAPADSVDDAPADSIGTGTEEGAEVSSDESSFSCDGRARCEQMTSCAEAVYFLRNCPGVGMDGNGDGEPCEMQWCGDTR